jgi:hypothetical protein
VQMINSDWVSGVIVLGIYWLKFRCNGLAHQGQIVLES